MEKRMTTFSSDFPFVYCYLYLEISTNIPVPLISSQMRSFEEKTEKNGSKAYACFSALIAETMFNLNLSLVKNSNMKKGTIPIVGVTVTSSSPSSLHKVVGCSICSPHDTW
ncbi:unnamed protein product [Citrullus colocynthis]|uniref:Uncharacterized protein n=1 Tax=Citrullus colocynthis TaxID=252529 RepID=A0ABP0XTW0_9ROSI